MNAELHKTLLKYLGDTLTKDQKVLQSMFYDIRTSSTKDIINEFRDSEKIIDLREKKITEQDILDLGWEGKINSWRLGDFALSGQLEYNVLEIEASQGYKHMGEYRHDWVTLFNGRIETKEELAWVMKAVGMS